VEGRPPTITGMHAQYTDDGGVVVLWATATDEGGPGGLTYTWAVVSTPPGGTAFVSPSVPGYSDARTYLSGTGPYTFRLTVRDAAGQTTTGELVFNYDPRYARGLEVAPDFTTVPPGGTVQLTAVVRDQFGEPMPDVDPDWEVFVGPGTITSSGLYTAPPDVSGDVAIQAQVPIGPSRYQNFIFKYATVRIESTRPPEPPINYGGGFAGADLLQNGSARVVGDRLRLADGPFQAGSAFAPTPVELNRQFVTRFQFQVGDAPDGSYGDGLTFVLQGAGPDALGTAGGGLGYAGIPNSVAVKFDLVDNAGEGTDTTGMYTNGAEPMVTAEGSNVALHSGHLFQVEARYDGHNLTVVLEDTVTGGYHIGYYKVDLAAVLGGTHAYAGFTAGTGELFAPIDILDWKYASTDNWDVTTIRL